MQSEQDLQDTELSYYYWAVKSEQEADDTANILREHLNIPKESNTIIISENYDEYLNSVLNIQRPWKVTYTKEITEAEKKALHAHVKAEMIALEQQLKDKRNTAPECGHPSLLGNTVASASSDDILLLLNNTLVTQQADAEERKLHSWYYHTPDEAENAKRLFDEVIKNKEKPGVFSIQGPDSTSNEKGYGQYRVNYSEAITADEVHELNLQCFNLKQIAPEAQAFKKAASENVLHNSLITRRVTSSPAKQQALKRQHRWEVSTYDEAEATQTLLEGIVEATRQNHGPVKMVKTTSHPPKYLIIYDEAITDEEAHQLSQALKAQGKACPSSVSTSTIRNSVLQTWNEEDTLEEPAKHDQQSTTQDNTYQRPTASNNYSFLFKAWNDKVFFRTLLLRALLIVLIISAVLVITSLAMNPTTLAVAAPVIAKIVMGLSPIAFNAILGTAIGMAAVSTAVAVGHSLYKNGIFSKQDDSGMDKSVVRNVLQTLSSPY